MLSNSKNSKIKLNNSNENKDIKLILSLISRIYLNYHENFEPASIKQ